MKRRRVAKGFLPRKTMGQARQLASDRLGDLFYTDNEPSL